MFGTDQASGPTSWRSDLRLDQYRQEQARMQQGLASLRETARTAQTTLATALQGQTEADVNAAIGEGTSKAAEKATAHVATAREAAARAEAALAATEARVAAFEDRYTHLRQEAQRRAGAAWGAAHAQAVATFVGTLRAAMAANTALAAIERQIREEFECHPTGRDLVVTQAIPGYVTAAFGELLDLSADRATYPHLASRVSAAEAHLARLSAAGLLR